MTADARGGSYTELRANVARLRASCHHIAMTRAAGPPLFLLLFLAACDRTAAVPDARDASPPPDADTASDDDGGCDSGSLPLQVLPLPIADGGLYPGKLYLPVTRGASRGLFLIDTGSAQTFLREELGSPSVTDAGSVQLGCDTLTLPGFAEAPQGTIDGVEVIGTFGLDRFLDGASLFDVDRARLTIHAPGDRFPEAAAWPSAPFDLVQRTVLLAHVTLEGQSVRLLVDTGSDHTLWLGQEGQPGDSPITTFDSAGNPLTLYLGTGQVTIGGWTERVPLVRAPSFPYLEDYVKQLGGNIAGLLGLSSYAHALEIDPSARVVRVKP
jgi:hypothetical protein